MNFNENRKMNLMVITKEPKEKCWICDLIIRFSNIGAQDKLVNIMKINYNIDLIYVHKNDDYVEPLRNKHPDLILIDLGIGRRFSKDIIQEIRTMEGQRHTGVIFFCDSQEYESTSVECLELGADDFLRCGCGEREVLARINSVLRLKSMTDELRKVNHRLQKLSHTDDLTGLYNMRAFEGFYSKAIKNCMIGNSHLAVFMLDLDHFKNVNDSINHLMGSYVISEVGKKLNSPEILSTHDFAARYGGDEYIIVTHDPTFESATERAEKIRKTIKNSIFTKAGNSVNITVSIGVAWIKSNYQGKEEDPIKAADMLLYESKTTGRDRSTGIMLNDVSDFSKLRCENIDGKKVEETSYDPLSLYKLSG